jgi:hypothetical protein
MKATPDYLIWTDDPVPHGCRLTLLSGFEDSWMLNKGIPCSSEWPDDVSFRMDPNQLHEMVLGDSVENNYLLLILSRRLADFIIALRPPETEVLPVTILDHRGRPVQQPYAIVNPIRPVDCLDPERSGAERSELDPSSINAVSRLVLDEAGVDRTRLLFRPLGFYDVTLVRRDLAQAITTAGFSGMRWTEIGNYPED